MFSAAPSSCSCWELCSGTHDTDGQKGTRASIVNAASLEWNVQTEAYFTGAVASHGLLAFNLRCSFSLFTPQLDVGKKYKNTKFI